MYHRFLNMQHMYQIFNFAREIRHLEEFVLPSVATDPNFGCFLQHTSSAPSLNGGSLSVQLTVGIRRYCGPIGRGRIDATGLTAVVGNGIFARLRRRDRMPYEAINFGKKFRLFNEQWEPRVIAEMNDYQ